MAIRSGRMLAEAPWAVKRVPPARPTRVPPASHPRPTRVPPARPTRGPPAAHPHAGARWYVWVP
jgi:hypothetical protein